MGSFIRALLCACAIFAGPALAQAPDDALAGLWISEQSWDSGPSGQLAIARADDGWSATIGDLSQKFDGDRAIAFEFPGHRGAFRGAVREDGRTIEGFWIQPHSPDGNPRDPDGKGQTYASPVTLKCGADGAWRGDVVPLPIAFTLFLKIFRDKDGALIAAFRNPEMNFRPDSAQWRVARTGNVVSFEPDPAQQNKALAGQFDERLGILKIRIPNLDRTFAFTRASPQQAAGFFPRPSGLHFVYREPENAGDGWTVAPARDEGFDEGKLAAVVQSIADADPATKRPDLINALLIARHGKLVLDEYFENYDQGTPHDLRSAGKTFSSVMLGALMREGANISPDTRLYPLVHGMGPFANPDPRKDTITLAQLMTHTSGLACDDNDDDSPGNEDTLQSQRKQTDWWKYALALPMAHDPGTRYAYCSAGANLMGAALTTAAGVSLPELFERDIARPLQWGPYYWNVMPNGQGYLGGGAFVRPRDLLKLGQAYLDGGVWNGHRLVDAAWVGQSTASRIAVSPATTGLSPEAFSNFYIAGEDGYAWHLAVLHAPGHDYRAYGASGNGGQLLIVVPELDLAVVFTGANYQQGLIWNAWRDKLLPTAIIPALRVAP